MRFVTIVLRAVLSRLETMRTVRLGVMRPQSCTQLFFAMVHLQSFLGFVKPLFVCEPSLIAPWIMPQGFTYDY